MNGIIRCTLVVGFGVGIALAGSAATIAAQGTEKVTSQPFGAIDGTVVDSAGHGIPGVEVFLFGARRGAHTNAAGGYRIDSVETGLHIVRFRRLGLRPTTLTVSIAPNDITGIDVVMPVMSQQLKTVVIQNALGDVLRLPKGFAQRMKNGLGSYFTANDIDRRRPLRTSDMLRGIAGISVSTDGVVSSGRGSSSILSQSCRAMPLYMDGSPMAGDAIDLIPPTAVAGIEVYKSAATMPLDIARPSPCGAILLWTK